MLTDPSPSGERRDIRTRFQPGHTLSMRHGGRSRRVAALELPEQAEARAALRERVASILVDLGGPETLSTVAVGLAERHARLELVADFLFDNVQRLGPLTGKGNTRAALTNWLQVVDRLHRSALALGLERRSKPRRSSEAGSGTA